MIFTEIAISSVLWTEAIKRLPQQKDATVSKQSDTAVPQQKDTTEGGDEKSLLKHPMQSLLSDIKDLQQEVDSKRFKYKDAQGKDVFIADSIFGKLDKYAAIGDIAIQHNPDVVALVWAGFRLLLQVCLGYENR